MFPLQPVRKRPNGYLVASFDDRFNLVAGCNFGTRAKVLLAVETACELVPQAPEYPAMEESYCMWAFLTILREMMRRREMPWWKAVEMIPYDDIPPIFRRVNLRKRFTQLRRQLERDVIDHGSLLASRDLHQAVIASYYPGTPEGMEAASRLADDLRRTHRPIQLPGGPRYHVRTLQEILDYYGLARRGRTNRGCFYRIRHGYLQALNAYIAEHDRVNLEGLYWMRGLYHLLSLP